MDTNVKFIRLKNGDDILSEVIEQRAFNASIEEHYWTLNNPLRVVYMANPNTGGMAVGLVNWVSSVFAPEQTFNLKDEDILIMTNITNDMIQNYYGTLEEINQAADTDTVEMATEEEEDLEDYPTDIKHYH